MGSQLGMFAAPPRAKPRKLMHVSDASPDGCYGDGLATVRMSCARCGNESDWIALTVTEAKRGIPCPNCNQTQEDTPDAAR